MVKSMVHVLRGEGLGMMGMYVVVVGVGERSVFLSFQIFFK